MKEVNFCQDKKTEEVKLCRQEILQSIKIDENEIASCYSKSFISHKIDDLKVNEIIKSDLIHQEKFPLIKVNSKKLESHGLTIKNFIENVCLNLEKKPEICYNENLVNKIFYGINDETTKHFLIILAVFFVVISLSFLIYVISRKYLFNNDLLSENDLQVIEEKVNERIRDYKAFKN